jgi:hypothetical protein
MSNRKVPDCHCGAAGAFGYRDDHGDMKWFCADHRLAVYWSDARSASLSLISHQPGQALVQPFDGPWHRCHCGAFGSFGINCFPAKGQMGTWFCADHRPISNR